MTQTQEAPSEFTRQPPQAIEAEQAVLGAMLQSTDAITDVVEALRPEDFYRPAHKIVYDAVLELFNAGEPADAVTVMTALKTAKQLERVGGAVYIYDLLASVPTAANAGYYARIVAERAILRRLVEAGTRIVQLGYGAAEGQGEEVAEAVNRASIEVEQVSRAVSTTGPVTMESLLNPTVDELEAYESPAGQKPGVPIHLRELAYVLPTLAPGSMTVVAGRPASGKSTLATNLAVHAAQAGVRSLVFSLEMSSSEIMQRILSDLGKVNFTAMRNGTMSDEDWSRMARRVGELMDEPPPLSIDDTPNQTPAGILATTRRFKQQHPDLRFVVIDYCQLVTTGKRAENRQVEVSEISRMMKLIAKLLDVAVLLVAQLNRGPEQRADKKPMASDLRESGALEQDPDNIILVHRPSMYDPDDRPGEGDLIVAKHRNGATGTAALAFQGHYCRFVDMA